MTIPKHDQCDDCHAPLTLDCTISDKRTGYGVAYYTCDNENCNNYGWFKFRRSR